MIQEINIFRKKLKSILKVIIFIIDHYNDISLLSICLYLLIIILNNQLWCRAFCQAIIDVSYRKYTWDRKVTDICLRNVSMLCFPMLLFRTLKVKQLDFDELPFMLTLLMMPWIEKFQNLDFCCYLDVINWTLDCSQILRAYQNVKIAVCLLLDFFLFKFYSDF